MAKKIPLAHTKERLYSTQELRRIASVKRHPNRYRVWALKGMRSRTGKLVVLEHVYVGRALHTSLEALGRFLEAMSQ